MTSTARKALLPIAFLAAVTTFAQGQTQSTFRAGVDLVRLVVTVRDRNDQLITDLSREDFEVVAARKPVNIEVFTSVAQPLSAVLLLQEVTLGGHERPRAVARAIVDSLGPRDRVMIGTTGQEIGFSPFFSDDVAVLQRVITEEVWLPSADHAFNLGNALRAATDRLSQAPPKRAIILIGSVAASPCGEWILFCLPPDQVVAEMQARQITVYGVSVQGGSIVGREEPGLSIARSTGGGISRPRSDDNLARRMADVLGQLRREYVLGFVLPTRDTDPTVNVRLRRPGLTAAVIRRERAGR